MKAAILPRRRAAVNKGREAFQLPWEKYSSEIKEEIYGVAAPCRIAHTVCGLLSCIFLLLFHYKIAVFQE
ncbi:hypothetical protein [Neisseria bacilliformis]|uniref:hypothetical protein n=1 Tax=Neisseria bacilliformis TaxID=267212 RepID=UPI000AFD2DBF|nr:hypothetical protein [Neisseria bacilliformis]